LVNITKKAAELAESRLRELDAQNKRLLLVIAAGEDGEAAATGEGEWGQGGSSWYGQQGQQEGSGGNWQQEQHASSQRQA
jgi:hypothetical protein